MINNKRLMFLTVFTMAMELADVPSVSASEMYEPNNTKTDAFTIFNNSFPYTAQISTLPDVDWYKITPIDSGYLTYQLIPPSGKNYDFTVLNSNNSKIAAGESGGPGVTETATFPVTQGQTYYFVIGSPVSDFSNTADYTFVRTSFISSFVPAYEPNNDNASAAQVDLYSTNVYAAIDSANDVDYYKFTASNTGSTTISLIPPGGRNYDIYVLDRTTSVVLGQGHLANGATENVQINATAGKQYTIIVYGVTSSDFSTIPYTLFKSI